MSKKSIVKVKQPDLDLLARQPEMNVDLCAEACNCSKVATNKKEIDDITFMMKQMMSADAGKKLKS